jgi:hypothetical protein
MEKVNQEVAEQEFDNFCEAMEIENDVSSMDDDSREDFEKIKKNLISAICAGKLSFNEENEPVFRPKSGDVREIHFKEPNAGVLLAIDKGKETQQMKKMFILMAKMSGVGESVFAQLKMNDFKICSGLVTLFLA